jgi:hypothetical protein
MDTGDILFRASPSAEGMPQTKATRPGETEAGNAILRAMTFVRNFEINGRRDLAIKELKKVIDAYPQGPGVDEAMAKLKELEAKSSQGISTPR